jgi:hypothetical protein
MHPLQFDLGELPCHPRWEFLSCRPGSRASQKFTGDQRASQFSASYSCVAIDKDGGVQAGLVTLKHALSRRAASSCSGALPTSSRSGCRRTSSRIALHSLFVFRTILRVESSMLIVRFEAPSFLRFRGYFLISTPSHSPFQGFDKECFPPYCAALRADPIARWTPPGMRRT